MQWGSRPEFVTRAQMDERIRIDKENEMKLAIKSLQEKGAPEPYKLIEVSDGMGVWRRDVDVHRHSFSDANEGHWNVEISVYSGKLIGIFGPFYRE